ncbi:hypothetical protein KLP28_01630 [Nocardioidaceae bacterium]|nr:hypothetical protein KLP28_01630 [Nocardioidaceae bacterium]
MTTQQLFLAVAERDQGFDLGAVLGGLAWFVLPVLAFMVTVRLGIRALRARNDMTETDSY